MKTDRLQFPKSKVQCKCISVLHYKQLWTAFGDILKDETKFSKADLLNRRKGGNLNKENVSKQYLQMPKHEDTKANLN